EIARGIDWLQSEQALARWQAAVEEHPRLVSLLAWLVQDFEAGQALQQLARTLSSRLPSVVSGSIWVILDLLITFFALFYFFRDRRPALRGLRMLVPLSEAETAEVFKRVADTIYATVY